MNIPKFIMRLSVAGVLLQISQDGVMAAVRCVAPSPMGNDANEGTMDAPWASPGKAARSARADDTIFFRSGTYLPTEAVVVQNSGSSDRWITFTAFGDDTVVIDGSDCGGQSDGRGLLYINGKEYIRVQKLQIVNSPYMGIKVENGSHIEILDNTVRKTYSCGIGVWGCAGSWCEKKTFSYDVKAIGNEVDRANSISTPPAPHEAISFAAVDGFEIAYNEVHHGKKEGIDCKESSRNGTIHHNHVHHHLERPWTVGIYVDAWFDTLRNVEIFENLVHDCDDGISIAAEDGPVTRDIFVHHNILYNFGWRGITLDGAGENRMRRNIWIYNNTVYNAEQAGMWVQSDNVDSVFILNNIFSGGWGRMHCDPDKKSRNIVIGYNLVDKRTEKTDVGEKGVVADPSFTDAAAADFSLKDGSPAIDGGSPDTAYNDPDGSRCDIGAVPFGANQTLVVPEVMNGKTSSASYRMKKQGVRIFPGSGVSSMIVVHDNLHVYDLRGKRVPGKPASAGRLPGMYDR